MHLVSNLHGSEQNTIRSFPCPVCIASENGPFQLEYAKTTIVFPSFCSDGKVVNMDVNSIWMQKPPFIEIHYRSSIPGHTMVSIVEVLNVQSRGE